MKVDRAALLTLLVAAASACDANDGERTAADDVIGGEVAPKGMLPATVTILESCTAAKVGERHLLLAAHCVYDPEMGAVSDIFRPGNRLRLNTNLDAGVDAGLTEKEREEQELRRSIRGSHRVTVEETLLHPTAVDFDVSDLRSLYETSDLAVVLLTKESGASIADIPIATVDPNPVKPGDELLIAGYGCEKSLNLTTPQGRLKWSATHAIAPADALATQPWGVDPEEMDGLYFFTPATGKDSSAASLCRGDSGGPVYRKGVTNLIAGVNSGGFSDPNSFSSDRVSYSNFHARIDREAGETSAWLAQVLAR
jgi:hypothetical protein